VRELLNDYVQMHIGSNKIPYTDLAEAMSLQDKLESKQMGESNYTVSSAVTLKETEAHTTVRVILLDVFLGGIKASLRTELRDNYKPELEPDVKDKIEYALNWVNLPDVEYLASIFKAERVDVFQQTVTMLGRLHRMQDAVKGLIAAGKEEE